MDKKVSPPWTRVSRIFPSALLPIQLELAVDNPSSRKTSGVGKKAGCWKHLVIPGLGRLQGWGKGLNIVGSSYKQICLKLN